MKYAPYTCYLVIYNMHLIRASIIAALYGYCFGNVPISILYKNAAWRTCSRPDELSIYPVHIINSWYTWYDSDIHVARILHNKSACTTIIIKIKIHSSCKIEHFVETHLCKLCVILRLRALRVVCPH